MNNVDSHDHGCQGVTVDLVSKVYHLWCHEPEQTALDS